MNNNIALLAQKKIEMFVFYFLLHSDNDTAE